jgi:succinate dehydrogenase / fumarate reductase membrane anchor subunit
LGRARGLGSAKEGLGHWIQQRVTAVALVPLSIWFLSQVLRLSHGGYEDYRLWIGVPGNATLLILLLAMLFHHAQLGIQMVLEDYVHGKVLKVASVVGTKLLALLMFVFSVVAVARTAFVGG